MIRPIKIDVNIPAEFVQSVKQLGHELGMLRQAATFGTFAFGVVVGLIAAAVLYQIFRTKT